MSSQPYRPELKTLRLVLIEDSDTDTDLIVEAARELAYDLQMLRFVTAAQAISGLEEGVRFRPHGILLDLNLPGGSGLDVLRIIRGSELTRKLRVVVMTSSSSQRDRETAERLGVEGYLNKPNDYYQFVQAVGAALKLVMGNVS